MGLHKEIIARCDLCQRKERFDEASNVREAQEVAHNRGWFIKKKGTAVDFVICSKCRSELAG